MKITIIPNASQPPHLESIKLLFRKYGEYRGFDQALGNYEQEIKGLPGKYAPPHGALLLALFQNRPAGCIAYQRLSPQVCEMKRMWVLPEYWNKGIGKKLIEELLTVAKAAGYHTMRLDSHPSMDTAQYLYAKFGFSPTERYNQNPTPGIRFFERKL